ncbi:MAG: helix-turn-helix transcriptional regulator, partial [Bacteroidota bacterium]
HMTDLRLKIKQIRELKTYSLYYMAERLGISQSNYSRYENLETQVSEAMLQQIAEVFELAPEQIKGFDEKVIFSNNNTLHDNSSLTENYCSTINQYVIDSKIEKLYEEQIALLKKQVELLEGKIGEMTKGGKE